MLIVYFFFCKQNDNLNCDQNTPETITTCTAPLVTITNEHDSDKKIKDNLFKIAEEEEEEDDDDEDEEKAYTSLSLISMLNAQSKCKSDSNLWLKTTKKNKRWSKTKAKKRLFESKMTKKKSNTHFKSYSSSQMNLSSTLSVNNIINKDNDKESQISAADPRPHHVDSSASYHSLMLANNNNNRAPSDTALLLKQPLHLPPQTATTTSNTHSDEYQQIDDDNSENNFDGARQATTSGLNNDDRNNANNHYDNVNEDYDEKAFNSVDDDEEAEANPAVLSSSSSSSSVSYLSGRLILDDLFAMKQEKQLRQRASANRFKLRTHKHDQSERHYR